MSIYASIEGIGDVGDPEHLGQPWTYQGSHIPPREDHPRTGSIGLALIPSHITADDRDDQPADGPPWPFLRLSLQDVPADDPTVLLDLAQARFLAAQLATWADRAEQRSMTDRIPLDGLNSDQYDALHNELDRLTAELRRYTEADSADAAAGSYALRAEGVEARLAAVRRLHRPVGVVAAAEFGEAPDCAACKRSWPCQTYTAVAEPEPEQPARTTVNNPDAAELETLRAKVAEFDHIISWHTTCAGCARILDSAYAETVRAEKAETALREVLDLLLPVRAGYEPPLPIEAAAVDRWRAVLDEKRPEPGVHIGNGANAEDCPGCSGSNPPYPFICPGPDAEQRVRTTPDNPPTSSNTPDNPIEERIRTLIESEMYEYRERTMFWPEGGVTEEIARLATRGALEALGHDATEPASADPASPRGQYGAAVHHALLTTPTRIPGGQPRPGTPDSHIHGAGHMYDMTCALCRGDAGALTAAVLAIVKERRP